MKYDITAKSLCALGAALLCAFATCAADEKSADAQDDAALAKRQARSVHLLYAPQAPQPESAMITVTVTQAQTNSYYMALGWGAGYCGLQDYHGQRIFIFSVWEPSNPFDFKAREADVKSDIRARPVFMAENVVSSRFEYEGTGMKTISNICWKEGEPVSIRIDSEPDGDDRMIFTAFIKLRGSDWSKVAAISTICRDPAKRCVGGIYSFVEDFWRNGWSSTVSRRAEYRDVKTRSKGGDWVTATHATFTADSTPSDNIDAGPTGDGGFFLRTGGDTKNEHVKLWEKFTP